MHYMYMICIYVYIFGTPRYLPFNYSYWYSRGLVTDLHGWSLAVVSRGGTIYFYTYSHIYIYIYIYNIYTYMDIQIFVTTKKPTEENISLVITVF